MLFERSPAFVMAAKKKKKKKATTRNPARRVRSTRKNRFAELLSEVDAIDWEKISNGSEGASFPKDLRRYLTKPSTDALDEIWRTQVDRPLGALASRFLMELLAHPDELGEVPYLLRLLVAMITHRHESWLGVPFAAEKAGFSYSRLNKWSAIAERRALVFELLEHADEKIRAHAAFLLAWLGRAYSGTIVPALWEKTKDPSALVRASALLAIGVHGEDGAFAEHLKDEEPRLVVAAAIAAAHASPHPLTDDVLDALGYAVNANVAWPDLPFCNGDLTSYALKCILQLDERYAARVRPWLKRHLDGPLAGDIVGGLIARTFPQGEEIFPLTEEKKAVIALIVENPKTHNGAIEPLRRAGFLFATNETARMMNELRKLAGLPRPVPLRGPLVEIEHEGEKRYAQHWIADFSETGQPEPHALARSIAQQASAEEVLDLLLMHHELDSQYRAKDGTPPFEAPLPEGGTLRDDGTLILPPDDWPRRTRIYMNQLRSEGWFIDNEWWFGSTARVRAHRDGWVLYFEMGHDWNKGDPIRTEAFFGATKTFSLARVLAQEAMTHCSGYEAALVARAKATTPSRLTDWIMERLTDIAVWSWGPRGERPPDAIDALAIGSQANWIYIRGPFFGYAQMLDDARREALVLGLFARTFDRVPELYAFAPTKRVQEELVTEVKRRIAHQYENDPEKMIASLEGMMGAHARTLITECSASPQRRRDKS